MEESYEYKYLKYKLKYLKKKYELEGAGNNNSFIGKIHGNYCGLKWCGNEFTRCYNCNYSLECVDELDCICKNHDKRCSKNGCNLKINNYFLNDINKFIEKNCNSDDYKIKKLVIKAKYMKFWVSLSNFFR